MFLEGNFFLDFLFVLMLEIGNDRRAEEGDGCGDRIRTIFRVEKMA